VCEEFAWEETVYWGIDGWRPCKPAGSMRWEVCEIRVSILVNIPKALNTPTEEHKHWLQKMVFDSLVTYVALTNRLYKFTSLVSRHPFGYTEQYRILNHVLAHQAVGRDEDHNQNYKYPTRSLLS
jgi:hypothetical protein